MSKGEVIFCLGAMMIVVFLLMREYIKEDIRGGFALLLEKQADATRSAEAQAEAKTAKRFADDENQNRSRVIQGFSFGLNAQPRFPKA